MTWHLKQAPQNTSKHQISVKSVKGFNNYEHLKFRPTRRLKYMLWRHNYLIVVTSKTFCYHCVEHIKLDFIVIYFRDPLRLHWTVWKICIAIEGIFKCCFKFWKQQTLQRMKSHSQTSKIQKHRVYDIIKSVHSVLAHLGYNSSPLIILSALSHFRRNN